jgi:NADPH:quinone reductase-like Zn-dependent oxidoreductase
MKVARRKKLSLLMHKPNKGLADLTQLLESGKVAPVVDRCFPLSQVPEAIGYLGEGNARGKVVITVRGAD